jgi:dihydrofolate synthase/folylpolyglutamate synthase
MEKESWCVFFDLFLMIALRYFGENHVDYIILEAGIGGRFDSTNFIEAPEAAVITSISLDHQNILGDTVEEIAWQKAGIIKEQETARFTKTRCRRSQIFTSGTQSSVVLEVLREQCKQMNAELHEVPISNESSEFLGKDDFSSVQLQNASLALAVLRHLKVSPEGMRTFYWPCRMEIFDVGGINVILDGCHNGDSVRLFMHSLKNSFTDSLHVILFGAGMEKCLTDMVNQILSFADCVMYLVLFRCIALLAVWHCLLA